MAKKWVYLFKEGNGSMRELLGGKGANLAEMTSHGLPVPQGFTITTEACTQYYEDGRKINDEIVAEIMANIEKMEEITGKKFGDLERPLLVSVRSGARASMPGMMDTILNLGLNEEVVEVMAKKSGNASMREILGGKGANLAEMTNIGLPVPQGFTISTEACTQYYEDGRQINDEIMAEIMEYIVKMEGVTGKKFGDLENPLLVSVRSGARASMPGMMDTILNLGLNEEVVEVMAKKSGNARWAYDCYRRFIQMYSDVVMEVGKKYF